MSRADRVALIQQIEKRRHSRVIVYCTSDRALGGLPQGQIADDAIRPLHGILRSIGPTKKLDFFLYTRGGAVDVPWRIVRALREYAVEWHCLIPFRAHSAGTMIAIGADEIVMGPQAELGPIDPSVPFSRLGTNIQDRVSVEDVMAFVSFVRNECKDKGTAINTQAVLRLLDRVDSVTLGNIYRNHAHIRDVARRILRSRATRVSETKERQIIKTLAERVYAHGHAIGFSEAQEIGLPVTRANDDLNRLMWQLLNEYETELKMLNPLFPAIATQTADPAREEVALAILETHDSSECLFEEIEIRSKRTLPQNFSPQLSLTLQLPPNLNPASLPADAQQYIQQIAQAALQQIQPDSARILLDELRKISPIESYDMSVRKMWWKQTA
jgi:Serine dehydrogenase proteinase